MFTNVYGACLFANPWPRFRPPYFKGLSNAKESTTSFFATADFSDFSGLADASGHFEDEAEEAIEFIR